MKRLMIALSLATLLLPGVALARGTKTMADNGQIVHSRRAGVIMHRAVPPFKGVHVYEGRQMKQANGYGSPAYYDTGW
jgi:hypothetical protein